MDSTNTAAPSESPLNARLNFALPPLTLSAWGVVMLHTWVTGRTKTLLHPFFQPMIAIAGAFLVLLAIAYLCYFIPRPRRGAWAQWLVLLVPVLIAAATAPKSFSDQMVAARGIQSTSTALNAGAVDADAERMLQKLAESDPTKPLAIDVTDVVSICGVPAVAQKLEGRVLHVRGQYFGVNKSDFKILRLVMYCCAADATPIGVLAHGAPPADLKNMDWIEIEGPVHFILTLGQLHAEIDAQSLQKIPTPANPYAY